MIEVLDMAVVTCDGRRAMADFVVWSPRLQTTVNVRVSYDLLDRRLVLESAGADEILGLEVIQSAECLADVHEAVMWQRDVLREKN